MDRSENGWISIPVLVMLFISVFFFGMQNVQEAYAAGPDTGTFHLKKYVNVDGREATGQEEEIEDPGNSLAGKEVVADVAYEIFRTHDYIGEKFVEITSGPVEILNSGMPYKTDAQGEINVSELPLGRYTFREVSAPEGFKIDPAEYYFVLPYTIGEDPEQQYEVYVYPKNQRMNGSLPFAKFGDNGTEGLKNVQFNVYYEDGSPVKDDDGKDLTVTTRLDGTAAFEKLSVGKYFLLEKENPDPDYFESSTMQYWFQIYQDGSELKAKAFYTDASMSSNVKDADGKDLDEGAIINYKTPDIEKKASVKSEQDITDGRVYVDEEENLYANADIPYVYTITTTLPKNLAEYTKFEIYDAFGSGNIVLLTELTNIVPVAKGGNNQPELISGADFEVISEGTGGYRLKFTDDGIAKLASAKCTSVEVTFDAKIPKGYQVDGSVKKGEINDAVVEFHTNHSDPSIAETQNTVYPRAGEIVIHKVDEKDETKLIAGANFSLTDAAGIEYWGGESTTYLDVKGNPTKNVKEAATFIFSQLPFGTYTLKETEAPSGYDIADKPRTIKLMPEKTPSATWLTYESNFKNQTSGNDETKQEEPNKGESGTTPGILGKIASSVKTGDQTSILLYVLGLSGACIVAIVLIYRKKSRK